MLSVIIADPPNFNSDQEKNDQQATITKVYVSYNSQVHLYSENFLELEEQVVTLLFTARIRINEIQRNLQNQFISRHSEKPSSAWGFRRLKNYMCKDYDHPIRRLMAIIRVENERAK
uniref:Uncharacterized protein n=1 Tax=Romanomermis culicivorax TaxID=13658 RepID=A0A915K984_ROMCU